MYLLFLLGLIVVLTMLAALIYWTQRLFGGSRDFLNVWEMTIRSVWWVKFYGFLSIVCGAAFFVVGLLVYRVASLILGDDVALRHYTNISNQVDPTLFWVALGAASLIVPIILVRSGFIEPSPPR